MILDGQLRFLDVCFQTVWGAVDDAEMQVSRVRHGGDFFSAVGTKDGQSLRLHFAAVHQNPLHARTQCCIGIVSKKQMSLQNRNKWTSPLLLTPGKTHPVFGSKMTEQCGDAHSTLVIGRSLPSAVARMFPPVMLCAEFKAAEHDRPKPDVEHHSQPPCERTM